MGDPLAQLDDAAAALGRGGVVVLPTETVYGLAALPDRPEAIERIYALKGRPRGQILQVLVPDAGWLLRLGEPSDSAMAIAHRYWPGPLTLIVPARDSAPMSVAGDGAVGVRVPAHRFALALLERTGPLAATSANRSGEPTPSVVDVIRGMFGDEVDAYIDGGRIDASPSTVIDLSGPQPVVRRNGAIPVRDIEALLGSRFERG